jgi:hypothetical protein
MSATPPGYSGESEGEPPPAPAVGCCAWPRRACARCTRGKRAPPLRPHTRTCPQQLRTARTASRARRAFRAHGCGVVRARQPHARTAGGPPQRTPARRGSRGCYPVRRLAGCRALASACRVRGGPRRSPLGLLPPPHLRLAATGSAAGLAPTPGPATPPPPRPLSLSLRRGAHCYEHLLCAGGPLDQGG